MVSLSTFMVAATAMMLGINALDEVTANQIKAELKKANVIPEAVDDFEPLSHMRIRYDEHFDLKNGELLKPEQTLVVPSIWFDAPSTDSEYTIAMVNLDTNGPLVRHWIATNVKGGDKLGTAFLSQSPLHQYTSYRGPTPPPGSGPHRIAFVLFEQQDINQTFVPEVDSTSLRNRDFFDLKQFAVDNRLTPISAAYFYTEHQDGFSQNYPAVSKGQLKEAGLGDDLHNLIDDVGEIIGDDDDFDDFDDIDVDNGYDIDYDIDYDDEGKPIVSIRKLRPRPSSTPAPEPSHHGLVDDILHIVDDVLGDIGLGDIIEIGHDDNDRDRDREPLIDIDADHHAVKKDDLIDDILDGVDDILGIDIEVGGDNNDDDHDRDHDDKNSIVHNHGHIIVHDREHSIVHNPENDRNREGDAWIDIDASHRINREGLIGDVLDGVGDILGIDHDHDHDHGHDHDDHARNIDYDHDDDDTLIDVNANLHGLKEQGLIDGLLDDILGINIEIGHHHHDHDDVDYDDGIIYDIIGDYDDYDDDEGDALINIGTGHHFLKKEGLVDDTFAADIDADVELGHDGDEINQDQNNIVSAESASAIYGYPINRAIASSLDSSSLSQALESIAEEITIPSSLDSSSLSEAIESLASKLKNLNDFWSSVGAGVDAVIESSESATPTSPP